MCSSGQSEFLEANSEFHSCGTVWHVSICLAYSRISKNVIGRNKVNESIKRRKVSMEVNPLPVKLSDNF